MKTSKWLTWFLLCLAFLLVMFYGLENRGRVILLEGQLDDLRGKFEAQTKAYSENVDSLSRQNEELQMQIDSMTAQLDNSTQKITELQDQLDHKMDLPLPNESDKNSRGGERLTKRTMHVTAYWEGSCNKEPDDPEYGITSSGEYVREWYTVAAGPELQIGTLVFIPYFIDMPNKGWFVVKDRGGAIENGELDVYMATAKACFKFGDPNLIVYILEAEI